ncbi:MAG: hypothetical protein P4L99_06765 [Chthoniobacter sp.]|nr:hypothetical protein [Chthoniobacter sp.]
MISPDVGIGSGPSASETLQRYCEPYLRERRQVEAYADLCAMSTDGDGRACAALAAHARQSLDLSNCHSSPKRLYPTPLHAWGDSEDAEKLNRKKHGEYVGAKAARDQKRRVRLHYEGTLIRIDGIPGWDEYENETKSKRGAVSGYSCKSRSRMLRLVASLNAEIHPQFVTLTYPHEWDNDPLAWKSDLDTFGKWLLRVYPVASFIWKLEPQKRGAPHFHLLVYGIPFLPWQTLAVRWAEIVNECKLPKNFPTERGKYGAHLFHEWVRNSIENRDVADHILAGVKVEAIRSHKGVMCYCSKKYMGKECALPEGWEKVGRFWGVVGRKNLPRSRVMEVEISRDAFARVRRTARRWFASKGLKRCGGGALTLFTSAHWQWIRVLELAETGNTVARDWTKSPP